MDIRKRQIDTLKIFNQNVTEIIPNDEYSVEFLSSDRNIKISVFLGPNFPNELPRLIINPILNHHWIDKGTGEILNAPGLVNFTVNFDLGRVVLAIIREFERYPPPLINQDSNVSSQNMSATQVNVDVQPSSTIPQLLNLSIDDLKRLDNDSESLDDFIEEYGFVKNLNDELDSLMLEVESIASENMSREQIINDLKNHLNETTSNLVGLGQKYDQLSHSYKKKSEEFTPQHIRELLQIAVSTSDTTCDEHVAEFLNGSLDVQTFLVNYMEAKKLSATRKAKEERLTVQLSALERATGH